MSRYPLGLTFDRYRELLDGDARRAVQVAPSGLDREVPRCPGWTGADAAYHLATVYLHKAAAIRDGTMPGPTSPGGWPPADLHDLPAPERLAAAYAALTEQFDAHEPSDPTHTWWPEDQSVGFWIRRMAHETSIHRLDLEGAAGEQVSLSPIDPLLAVDGIDEVLTLMLAGDWSDEPQPQASGSTIELSSAGQVWSVTLTPEQVAVTRSPADDAAARVSGEPAELLLWLWGRGDLPSRAEGAPSLVIELRDRTARATQ